MDDRERIARAIWARRPDCHGKPWPIETDEQRRAHPHNPIAACDLCFIYADAALGAMRTSAGTFIPGHFSDRIRAGDRLNPEMGAIENRTESASVRDVSGGTK